MLERSDYFHQCCHETALVQRTAGERSSGSPIYMAKPRAQGSGDRKDYRVLRACNEWQRELGLRRKALGVHGTGAEPRICCSLGAQNAVFHHVCDLVEPSWKTSCHQVNQAE